MTNAIKRPRGRPKGSEIDDREVLSRIAELMVQGNAGNVAFAVRRVAGHDPSLIRRLQRKFRRDRDTLLRDARARLRRAATERETWLDEIERVTEPLTWHLKNDPTLQMMDALTLERQERLQKSFSQRSGKVTRANSPESRR